MAAHTHYELSDSQAQVLKNEKTKSDRVSARGVDWGQAGITTSQTAVRSKSNWEEKTAGHSFMSVLVNLVRYVWCNIKLILKKKNVLNLGSALLVSPLFKKKDPKWKFYCKNIIITLFQCSYERLPGDQVDKSPAESVAVLGRREREGCSALQMMSAVCQTD